MRHLAEVFREDEGLYGLQRVWIERVQGTVLVARLVVDLATYVSIITTIVSVACSKDPRTIARVHGDAHPTHHLSFTALLAPSHEIERDGCIADGFQAQCWYPPNAATTILGQNRSECVCGCVCVHICQSGGGNVGSSPDLRCSAHEQP